MTTRLILREAEDHIQVLLQREGQTLPEASGPAEPFEVPLIPQEREDLRWYLEDYLRAPYAVYEERGAAIDAKLPEWGERMFAAVFGPGRPGRDAYQQAGDPASCELWISSASPAFLGLPWELLKDPDRPTHLALSFAGVNRTLAAQHPPAERRPGSRLRVLMVIARPAGRRDVRYRMIARPLLERLEPVAGEVELEVLRPPTFEALKRRLEEARSADEPFQILHFDGHGSFGIEASERPTDPLHYRGQAAQGYLLFETDEGDHDPVAAEVLAPRLDEAGVPLLVFNACQSGMVDGGEGPEAAVATRLLSGGAAAVVAMSYSVYAVAAAEFMAAFYEALFAGDPVSRAVTEGRRQLQRANRRPSPKGPLPLADWMVPVCYERAEVAFPELRRRERPGPLTLEAALADLREERQVVEGVHPEGDLSPEGGRFFGRDAEIQELERAFRLRRVVLLHGVGGTGKTELAKAFARWLQASGGLEHPDLVFFHSFEPGIASFGLDGVVSSVGLRLFGAEFARLKPEERRQAVLSALRRARILLVWDNCETVHSMPDPMGLTPSLDEKERGLVREFLDEVIRDSRGGVILTSRSPEAWLGDCHRLELGGLDPEDVNELAQGLLAPLPQARERRNDPDYSRLLEVLAGHPLSLRLVLPRLAESSPGELVAALRGEGDLPEGFGEGEGRLASLGASVHYSFRHLPAAGRERLPALALFEGVADVGVLAILSANEGTPERFRGVEKGGWEETLDRCTAAGLLTRLGAGMYRIHPALPTYLLALWRQQAEEAFSNELEAARLASIHAHAALGVWLYRQLQGGSAETALAVLAAERRTLGAAAALALEAELFTEVQAILQPLDELWDTLGMIIEARAWVDRCREALEGETGQPPDLETPEGALWLFMVGSQANRMHRAGALDEAEAQHDAIRQMLEASTGDGARRRLAVSYHQLGMVAQDRGDLSGAESWYRKSLEIVESLNDQTGIVKGYHQLGIVAQLGGDLSGAESLYRKALEIEESLDYRSGMASSYHQLGIVAQERGDLSGAESWYRKSLEIVESLNDQTGIARSYHQLGIVAQLGGDLSGAEAWYRKSLEIEESLGNRPGMALSYAQLGLLAEAREDPSTALDWVVRCVALFPEFPHHATGSGPHHLARLTTALGMGAVEETWRRCTGKDLPANVRAGLEKLSQ